MPTFKIVTVTDSETYVVVTNDDGSSYGQTFQTPRVVPVDTTKEDISDLLQFKADGKGKSELLKIVGQSLDVEQEKQKMDAAAQQEIVGGSPGVVSVST